MWEYPKRRSRRRTVLGCQRSPPRGGLILSEFSAAAICRRDDPAARIALIRSDTSEVTIRGLPRTTPCERLTAKASLVRSPISRRSNWAKLAMTEAIISPCGVDVSTPRSSATIDQPRLRLRCISAAKSSSERDKRSSFATKSAPASPPSICSIAARSPGRLRLFPLSPASSSILDRCQPRASQADSNARRWASRPAPESA